MRVLGFLVGLLNSEEENLNSRGSPEEYEHTKLALDENEISLNFKLIVKNFSALKNNISQTPQKKKKKENRKC